MLKNHLLKEFEQNIGTPLSGQYLADRYQVSRNAVWKAVKALEQEGWPILTSGKKGYLLDPEADLLSEQGIRSFLKGPAPDQIRVFHEVDSTNAEAMRMVISGFTGSALIVSDAQTMGRGHCQSTFYSPGGTGLYMSLLLPASLDTEAMRAVGKAASVCVIRSVRRLTGRACVICRTSDIYLDGKKIGGILAEAISPDLEAGIIRNVCIGIGLNLTTKEFPKELAETFSSLGGGCRRNQLAAAITEELLAQQPFDPTKYLSDYEKYHADL